MVKKIMSGVLCGAIFSIAPSAFAQASDASPFADLKVQPYVQGAVGSQRVSSPSSTGMAMDLDGAKTQTAARVSLGAQLSEYVGVELTWFQVPRTTLQTRTGDTTYKGESYAISLTGSVPIQQDLNLVGRIGMGRSNVDVAVPATSYTSNSRKESAVWGLGVRYALDKSTDVTVDYDNLGTIGKYALGDRVKADMISFGLRFKF